MKKTVTLCAPFVLLLLVVLQVPSIVSSQVYASDGVAWTKYQGNPLNMGLAKVVEPWVIYDGSTFKMWYAGLTDAHRIYYATSSDGISWAPQGMVLNKGEPGSWDEHQVRNPIVLFDGASYRMWYSGYIYATAKIGFATSPDGIHWTKYDQNPVLVAGGNGGWDDYTVGAFTVMLEGSKYWMWYNGVRAEGDSQQIGVATSPDGVSWTKYSANPVLVPGPNEWDNYHVYTGPVLKSGGLYRMWYTGQSWATNRIGLATSSDGYSWSKYEANPVLDVGPSGAWDSGYVLATTVLEENGNLLMWYWGSTYQAGGNVQIGLAMAVHAGYYLTVKTDPPGAATIAGEGWYDASATPTLTAPVVSGKYSFRFWFVDGVYQGSSNVITVPMSAPRTAIAYYAPTVGGEWAPISTVQLVTPWIALIFLAIAFAAAGSHRLLRKRL